MSRPKGSKNKTTLMKENKNIKYPTKKIVKDNTTAQHIKQLEVRRGRPSISVSHVLKINEWLYITCDKHGWILKEVNNTVNPNTNEKYPDKSLLYAPHLDQMIKVLAHYMNKVPGDFYVIVNKLDEIKKLIEKRIPKGIKPKDLFEEMRIEDEDT